MTRYLTIICCSAWLLFGGVMGDARPAHAQGQKMTDITFKEEGLNVKIIPAKGTAAAIQAVESGVAQIGFIDVPSLVIARAGGATSKIVAVIYQKAPYTIFSLDPGADVTSLKGLVGLTVGSHNGSFVSNITKAVMRKNGLDPNSLKVENIEPSARVAMLAARKVPAVDFYIMSKPGIERAVKGAKVRSLLLADFGLDLYSNAIGAKESFLKENPEVMKKFVRAGLRGYQYAFAHPEEAAELQKKSAKALNAAITVEELKIVKDMSVTPEVIKNGLGTFTPEHMKQSVEWVVQNAGFDKAKAPKPEDIYATGFLPTKPIMVE
jgi:NitT/TauT family transport system substrate-binding protein